MDTSVLTAAGLVPISGAEVFGGEGVLPPLAAGMIIATYSAVLTAVVANWDAFKDGLFEGYNSTTH